LRDAGHFGVKVLIPEAERRGTADANAMRLRSRYDKSCGNPISVAESLR
jgi:hypothetical protein